MYTFEYDYVFDELASQEAVYAVMAAPLIESALNGLNTAILAYGQTGS